MKKQANLYAQLSGKVSAYSSHFSKSIGKTLCAFVCALMIKQTVNLNVLKFALGGVLGKPDTRADSHYKLLTRFFNSVVNLRETWKTVLLGSGKLILERLRAKNQPIHLLLDGTSWSYGTTDYHFLVLSVLYEGVSVPLFFVNLDKKGCSNFKERKRFLQQANQIYKLSGMTLIADREYVGREWFAFLEKEMKMYYVIRLSMTDYKKEVEASGKSYSRLFRKTRQEEIRECVISIQGCQMRMLVRANPNPDKDAEKWVILISNHFNKSKKKLYHTYRFRWQIECMFKNLKTNGFNLEDLGLKNPQKARLMLAIVIATYILCIVEGLQFLHKRPIRKDKLGQEYVAISIFKHGFEFFNKHTLNMKDLAQYLCNLFQKSEKYQPPKTTPKTPEIQNVQ
jgi:hypothetical protein